MVPIPEICSLPVSQDAPLPVTPLPQMWMICHPEHYCSGLTESWGEPGSLGRVGSWEWSRKRAGELGAAREPWWGGAAGEQGAAGEPGLVTNLAAPAHNSGCQSSRSKSELYAC